MKRVRLWFYLPPLVAAVGLGVLAWSARVSVRAGDTAWLLLEEGALPGFERGWWLDPSPTEERLARLLGRKLIDRDAEGNPAPAAAVGWELTGEASVGFWNERGAATAMVTLELYNGEWKKWGLVDTLVEGSELLLEFDRNCAAAVVEIATLFDAEAVAPVHRFSLQVRDSAREALAHFRAGALRDEQIITTRFVSEREAEITVRGEKDAFFEEMQEHFRSQPALDAIVALVSTGKSHAETRLRVEMAEIPAIEVIDWLRALSPQLASRAPRMAVELGLNQLGLTFDGEIEDPVSLLADLPVLMAVDGAGHLPLGGPYVIADSEADRLILQPHADRSAARAAPAELDLRFGWSPAQREEALVVGRADAIAMSGARGLRWPDTGGSEGDARAWLQQRFKQ